MKTFARVLVVQSKEQYLPTSLNNVAIVHTTPAGAYEEYSTASSLASVTLGDQSGDVFLFHYWHSV